MMSEEQKDRVTASIFRALNIPRAHQKIEANPRPTGKIEVLREAT